MSLSNAGSHGNLRCKISPSDWRDNNGGQKAAVQRASMSVHGLREQFGQNRRSFGYRETSGIESGREVARVLPDEASGELPVLLPGPSGNLRPRHVLAASAEPLPESTIHAGLRVRERLNVVDEVQEAVECIQVAVALVGKDHPIA